MSRSNQSAERGGSKLSLLITLVILGSMGFAGFKIVPTYVNNYQMQDSIESESRFALTGYPKKSADDVRSDVLKKAQELGVPLKADDIVVNMSNTNVEITATYSVTFDLAVYQWTRDFQLHADNHTI
jgi:Domain of unknown function (DUF4845)